MIVLRTVFFCRLSNIDLLQTRRQIGWKTAVSVFVDDRFYIALFSALEQTHCAARM